MQQENILHALKGVVDKLSGRDVVSMGLISGLVVKEGKVGFLITIAPDEREAKAYLQQACETAVKQVPGVESVTAVLTAEHGAPKVDPAPARKAVWNTEPLAHVKRVIAVASGKGGVGKSTTAVNLAHACSALGLRMGLLDADIYGPSLPRMMGLNGQPEVTEDHKIIPLEAYGIACMSMGLLVGEGAAVVWRGPQVSKALQQMLRGVEWGTPAKPMDILLIDMPPGTGDTHLSLVQQVPLSGAIIVTTPQEVAVADARKSIDMLRKVNVPIMGVIENMSGFTDASGKVHAIFGEGGGARLAAEAGVKLLGQVPIVMELRTASDEGQKFVDKAGVYKAAATLL